MKKLVVLLLACAMVCALLPAAQADGLYGIPASYELTGAAGTYGGTGPAMAYELTGAAGFYGTTATASTYGMTGTAPACGLSAPALSCGVPAGYSSCAPAACVPASGFKAFKGFVNGYRINVRSCPGTSSTVCGVVSYGDPIYVTNYTYVSSKLWYYGSIGSLCGWIFSGYVGGAPTFTPTPVTGCAVPSGYGTICMNATNFRTGPGMYYASLMQLSRGTRVQLLCAVTDVSGIVWYQVLTSGYTGWVRSDLITTAGCASYGTVSPYTAAASFTGYTNTNAVNVRYSPNGTVITQVSRGTTVYVYGIVCHCGVYWYQVRFYGGVGYIRADLVSVYGCPGTAPGIGVGSAGINYYDYSDNSTTIITEGTIHSPVFGSDAQEPAGGYGAPSCGYGDPAYGSAAPDYGYSGTGDVPGGFQGGKASGQPYGGYADTADAGYKDTLPTAVPMPASLYFTTCSLNAGQTLPVYSAPNTASLRADSGTAQVTLTESLYAAGFDGQWMMVMYRNQDKMTRVGYVNAFELQGMLPNLPSLTFGTKRVMIAYRTAVTSDPMEQTDALLMLNAGDGVTFLATLHLNGSWAYVETMYNGVPVRGFVPLDAVR